MDHRATSIQFLKSTGLIPVKVPPGQKAPGPEWDPRGIVHADHSGTLLRLERETDLNLGALFSGKWVDVDIDSSDPNLFAALDYFLPKTPYVWGRKSKLRSHRAYLLNEEFDRGPHGPILRYIKALAIGANKLSIEVRGGKPENGLFTVLPGSHRQDVDEDVEWSADLDPTITGAYVPVETLIRAIRMAQAAALIVPYWVEGVRNDVSLALSGLMWRMRKGTLVSLGADDESEISGSIFLINEEDATALLTAVMRIAGDDPTDSRSRILNLKNTWRKLDNDPLAKITGGKVLATLMGGDGESTVKALYRLLSDSEGIEQLEALVEQFVMWYGQGVLIDMELAAKGMETPWMSREAAANSLGGKRISIGGKKIPIVNMLFNTQIVQRVYGLTFDPSSEERIVTTPRGLMVNQWKGFGIDPCTQRVTDSEVEPFLSYVHEVLAAGDDGAYNWILDWTADLFQRPAEKPGTAVVLVGVQGAGKTFFGERIIAPIIGPDHSTQMNSIGDLTNKFNAIADNKVFIQCDEAVHSYQKDVANRLKSIVTDKMVTIEPKGVNSFKKPNHMHFLFTSNDEHGALFIDPSPHERRFTVLKVSKKRAADIEYWNGMHAWVAANLSKILRWLLDRRYDKKTILRPLNTEAKVAIQRVGVDLEVSWIVSRIASGFPIGERLHEHWFEAYDSKTITDKDRNFNTRRRDSWPNTIMVTALEADFKEFVRGHGRTLYSGSISTTLRRVFPEGAMGVERQTRVNFTDPKSGQQTITRVRHYTMPPVEQILEHLKAVYGSMVDVDIALEKARDEDAIDETTESEEEF